MRLDLTTEWATGAILEHHDYHVAPQSVSVEVYATGAEFRAVVSELCYATFGVEDTLSRAVTVCDSEAETFARILLCTEYAYEDTAISLTAHVISTLAHEATHAAAAILRMSAGNVQLGSMYTCNGEGNSQREEALAYLVDNIVGAAVLEVLGAITPAQEKAA